MIPYPEQSSPYLLAAAARHTRPSVPDDKWEPSPYPSRFPVPPPNSPPPETHRESPTLPTPIPRPNERNPLRGRSSLSPRTTTRTSGKQHSSDRAAAPSCTPVWTGRTFPHSAAHSSARSVHRHSGVAVAPYP